MKSQQAQVAAIIRKKLKDAGIHCTAKSSSFSMGNSVDINVENQPPWIMKAIKEQTDCYEYGTFDAMTDCQGFKNRDFDGPQTKYLSINNRFTDDVRQAAWTELRNRLQGMDQFSEDVEQATNSYGPSSELYKYLTGYQKDFMYSGFMKPRIAA